jgi:sec-independent protein translocase protein TatA
MTILTVTPLFLGKIGAPELILLLVLLIVFFGAKKIPDLMKGMGRGIKEFKDAVNKDYSNNLEGNNDSNAGKSNSNPGEIDKL